MLFRSLRWLTCVIPIALLTIAAPAVAQTAQRCFPETNQCISGPIRTYWERNGGLAVFGYPITAQAAATVEGRSLQVQWFERDRLELDSAGAVAAGRLGAERLEQLGTPFQQGPGDAAAPGCRAFPETGYQLCEPFLSYWQKNGGVTRFGLPLTGAFGATLEGKSLVVQYFERRRFEQDGSQVQLGLLGREVLAGQGAPLSDAPAQPTPIPAQPQPQPAPTPAPQSGKCDPSYPTVCIPPPPPDLDCGDIKERNFKVLPPDPHKFDRDHDGIGCES